MNEPNRIMPALDAGHMKTYEIRAPKSTHFRPASCEEVECQAHARGWRTLVDVNTELGARQAFYIRKTAGRAYSEEAQPGGRVVFTFLAGQKCFREHVVPTDRPPLFIVREGDWRGNPRQIEPRIHTRPEDWVDEFANHQSALAEQVKRG